ncbi:DUF2950 domain-containing protein [Burkholderia cepacia]|uniref:DUF2950 domain-containing protein n=1 Tax=Burkholderia cepacia TaxID=292 RepID=UPI0009BAFA73|nr:DUF2950 domain-containing protein [Burkholderia cepacia]
MNCAHLNVSRSAGHIICELVLRVIHLFAVPAMLLIPPQVAHAQAIYTTPSAASNAFVDALASNDLGALRIIFGKKTRTIIPAEGFDPNDIDEFLGAWAKRHQIVYDAAPAGTAVRAHLMVGATDWVLPIPLVHNAAGWSFDLDAARDEILTRTIGRNENAAMLTSRVYVDAQHDYHGLFGVYAQRLVSKPGKRDGLYWPASSGEAVSPFGPLAAMMERGTAVHDAYHGYHYQILTAQGPHAPGGVRDYVERGSMTAGFALIAWPAVYGETGLTTFIINQDGRLYQKNLGPRSAQIAQSFTKFDPDPSWQLISP